MSTTINHHLSSKSTKSSSSFPSSHSQPSSSSSFAESTISLFSYLSISEREDKVLKLEAIPLGGGIMLEFALALALALVSNLDSSALATSPHVKLTFKYKIILCTSMRIIIFHSSCQPFIVIIYIFQGNWVNGVIFIVSSFQGSIILMYTKSFER